MKEFQESEIDEMLLDRLVDGELDEGEYRLLLAALESKPDGWRRCAMAFLEAQAWGRELRGLRDERPKSIPPRAPARSNWAWTNRGFITLACAASFVLAFVVVPAVLDSGRNRPAYDEIAGTTKRFKPSIPASDTVAGSNGRAAADAASSPNVPPQQYQLVVQENGKPKQIQMPIFGPDDPRAHFLLDERAAMPVELMQRLVRMGYEVDRQRQWTPVGRQGGGQVMVPIEELHITPVSGRSYQ